MEYDSLATFAKTWGLVYMVILFLGAVFYALRPGAKETFDKAAQMPLRED